MPPTSVPAPVLLTDPGYLAAAPIGTAEPTPTVAGSVFTDTWAAAWIQLGGTEDGTTFAAEIGVEPISVAEFFEPIQYATTSRALTIAFAMASFTLHNVKRAFNGGMGAITADSGTGATTLASFEPPDPGSELRIMILWESLDHTLRLVCRQCINAGTIESAFQKVPAKGLLPCTFSLEKPAAAKSFKYWSAGTNRLGS